MIGGVAERARELCEREVIVRVLGGRADRRAIGRRHVTVLHVVDDIVAANPDKVAQARAKPQLIGWFVGQVMKSSGGKANPQAVNDLLKSKLGI